MSAHITTDLAHLPEYWAIVMCPYCGHQQRASFGCSRLAAVTCDEKSNGCGQDYLARSRVTHFAEVTCLEVERGEPA